MIFFNALLVPVYSHDIDNYNMPIHLLISLFYYFYYPGVISSVRTLSEYFCYLIHNTQQDSILIRTTNNLILSLLSNILTWRSKKL